jgi:hypothetical protein
MKSAGYWLNRSNEDQDLSSEAYAYLDVRVHMCGPWPTFPTSLSHLTWRHLGCSVRWSLVVGGINSGISLSFKLPVLGSRVFHRQGEITPHMLSVKGVLTYSVGPSRLQFLLD